MTYSDPNARLADLTSEDFKLTNRSGAYACTTPACMNTRRTHGLLVAQRIVILSRAEESLRIAGSPNPIELACNQYPGVVFPRGDQFLSSFSPTPSPTWLYSSDTWKLEKRLELLPDQNTILLTYNLLSSTRPMELSIRPLFALRPQSALMYQWNGRLTAQKRLGQDYRIPATARTPEAFFSSDGSFESNPLWYYNTIYRGTPDGENAGLEDLFSPGPITWALSPNEPVHFACSTDPVSLSSILRTFQSPAPQPVLEKVEELSRLAPIWPVPSTDKLNPDQRSPRSNHFVS